jgi:hypothetical protein
MITKALVAAVALGIAAPTASAATALPGTAAAGPVIVGDSVLWAEGSLIKKDGQVVATAPDPTPAEGLTDRSIQGLAASPTRLLYVRADRAREDDAAGTSLERDRLSPWLSSDGGGTFTNSTGCAGQWAGAAIEGDTVVVAQQAPCQGVFVNGQRFGTPWSVTQVRIAGPYVAWIDLGQGSSTSVIEVDDVKSGHPIATFPGHSNYWQAFDIDAQGNIVAVRNDGKLVAFSVKKRKQRVLSKRAGAYVETAGGRIAYISTDGRNHLRSLNLIDRKGKVLRRLDRFTSRRQPAGTIALTENRIAWSAGGNILTQTL